MASARGREDAPVADRLFEAPEDFDFFQAVRLLALIQAEAGAGAPFAVGGDEPPSREAVRLRTASTLGFASGPVEKLARTEARTGRAARPPEMTVGFFGLVGASGALPHHYTETVLRRLRAKDRALLDFLDVFDHRALSFFYRAWAKYRLPVEYERTRGGETGEDPISVALRALVGAGTPGLSGRVSFHEDAPVFFAGHFSRGARPADSLARMLSDYFELPFEIEPFHGDWILLDPAERSVLPTEAEPRGRFCRLGRDLVVGSRAFDAASRFRVRVGPLTYEQFRELMPTGSLLAPVCDLIRSYVGVEYAFDVQPVLAAHEAPGVPLGAWGVDPPRLGWNTWLRGEAPIAREFDGVSFSLESRGTRVLQARPPAGKA